MLWYTQPLALFFQMNTYIHNPRCSKSRQGLALLEERGVQCSTRLYLENLLSKEELASIIDKLGITPLELLRQQEPIFKELGYTVKDEREDSEWISLMVEYPKLIERPILVSDTTAVVGRPPERLLEIL